MTLRRSRNVQSALDSEVFPLEARHVQAARADEAAARLVAYEGVIVPAVPQQPASLDELFGDGIALGMRRMLAAEDGGRFVVGGGDHVPGGPPARQMVERGESACHVIGLGIGRRGRS